MNQDHPWMGIPWINYAVAGEMGGGDGGGAGSGGAPASGAGDAGGGAGGEGDAGGGQNGGAGGESAGAPSGEGGEGGQPASPWQFEDNEEGQALKAFVGEKTPAQIAKELHGAQELIGKKTIGVPDENSTPEEQAAFHKARGVPDADDGYDFQAVQDDLVKDIPEADRAAFLEANWDKDEEARFRALAKSANLSQTEAKEFLQREIAHRVETGRAAAEAEKKVATDTTNLITEKWGNKEEEYSQDANNFAREMGITGDVMDGIRNLSGSSAETRFKIAEFFRTEGALLREGGVPGQPGGRATGQMTPDQARVAKEEYLNQGDNRAAYQDSNHPNYKMVEAKVTEFLRIEKGLNKKG